MLPAQIPLTLEHLFPTPSISNVKDRTPVLFISLFILRSLFRQPHNRPRMRSPG